MRLLARISAVRPACALKCQYFTYRRTSSPGEPTAAEAFAGIPTALTVVGLAAFPHRAQLTRASRCFGVILGWARTFHRWLDAMLQAYRASLERAIAGIGKQIRLGIDLHGPETQLQLVAAGLGLGLIPRHLLARSRQRQGLSVVKVKDLTVKIDVWLMHAEHLGNLRRAVSALQETLSMSLGESA